MLNFQETHKIINVRYCEYYCEQNHSMKKLVVSDKLFLPADYEQIAILPKIQWKFKQIYYPY